MKTRLTRSAGIALAAVVFLLSGCGKDPVSAKPPAITETPKACDPFRNVTGYTTLISEINGFSICAITDCSGGSVTSVVTHDMLCNSSGSPFNFSSVQTITPTDQHNVMKASMTWGLAHQPAGYFVSAISYNDDIITGGSPSYSGIDIVVTYRKCTGSNSREK